MTRHILAATLLTILTLTAWDADACSPPLDGWFLDGRPVIGTATGPFVMTLRNDGFMATETPTYVVTVTDSAGNEVSGTTQEIQSSTTSYYFSWTPDAPLEDNLTLEANVTVTESQIERGETVDLQIRETLPELSASISERVATEVRVDGTQECCEVEESYCFSGCGLEPPECTRCFATSYVYPSHTQAVIDLESIEVPSFYQLEVVELNESGETVLTTLEPYSGARFGVQTGNWDEGESFESCVAVRTKNLLDGTSVLSEAKCVTDADVETIERDEAPGLDAEVCIGSTVIEVDEDGNQSSRPLDKADGGCSAASSPSTGLGGLFLLALVALRRRSTRR